MENAVLYHVSDEISSNTDVAQQEKQCVYFFLEKSEQKAFRYVIHIKYK